MPVDSAPNLVDLLQRFELLDASQLDELARGQPADSADAQALADELLRRGWLTSFQIEQLFQGRGQELALGNYVLLDRLGEGGMGQVFKARHRRMGRVVALKVINRDQVREPSALRRFQREIEAAAQLEHPNVVRAYDADQAGEVHFFVMEYVEGIDLGQLVKRDGPLEVQRACDFIRQAALGLQHAHERGLVHRDIKPTNLLLTTRDNVVKVLDLGLARLSQCATSPRTLTRDGAVMGTPDFIAPEQARDAHTADIRADLYSLGCTLYFLLTGEVPFPGGSLTEKLLKQQFDAPAPLRRLRPEVSPAVAAVVYRLMAKKPEDRYQTAAEVAAALTALTESVTLNTSAAHGLAAPTAVPNPFAQSTPLTYPTVEELAPAPRKGRRALLVVGCGVLLVALATLVGWRMWVVSRGSPPAKGRSDVPPAESPEQAVAVLKQLGATVTPTSDSPDAAVVAIDCTGMAVGDADLAHLKALVKLEKLYLYDTPIGDAGLAHLRGLPRLQLLGLGKTRVTDEGLFHLRELPQLQLLWLTQTKVTDEGLAHLESLTRLRRLYLGGTGISDAGLKHLYKLRELKTLDLTGTKVSDEGVQTLRAKVSALKILR